MFREWKGAGERETRQEIFVIAFCRFGKEEIGRGALPREHVKERKRDL